MIKTDTRYMVYRASRETHSISALRFASTCFPLKDPTPAPRGSPRVPQGLPHRLRALQATPLANSPPGPRTTGSRANRMSWRLPATVVLLLYLSLNSLSPHPVFSRLTEPTATSLLPALATLRHPPHTRTHTPRHNHTPRTASRDTIRRPHTPPHFTTHTQPNRVANAQPERHEALHLLGTLIRTVPRPNRQPREIIYFREIGKDPAGSTPKEKSEK